MREHSSPISIMLHFQSDIPQSPEETSRPACNKKYLPGSTFITFTCSNTKHLLMEFVERLFTGRGDQERISKDVDIKRQDFTTWSIYSTNLFKSSPCK